MKAKTNKNKKNNKRKQKKQQKIVLTGGRDLNKNNTMNTYKNWKWNIWTACQISEKKKKKVIIGWWDGIVMVKIKKDSEIIKKLKISAENLYIKKRRQKH